MLWGVDLKKGFARAPIKYERVVQRVFETDSFETSGDTRNSFVLSSGGGDEGCSLWAGKLLLSFRISARTSNESHKYAFLQYMEVVCLIDMVDEILRCVYLSWITDHEVEPSLRRGADICEQRNLSVDMKYNHACGDCARFASVVKTIHATVQFKKEL